MGGERDQPGTDATSEPATAGQGAQTPAASERLDSYMTLRRASELAGLDLETLRVHAVRGRLRSVRRGGEHLTTLRWLRAYLSSRDDEGSA